MLELETAGTAFASEAGIQIANAPDGVTFAPLDDHEPLGTLVGVEDKFTAQNAALWQRGLLVHVPQGVERRQASLRPECRAPRRRLALLAPACRRRGRQPAHPDRGVRLGVVLALRPIERRAEPSSAKPRSSSTCRSRTSPGRRGISPPSGPGSTGTRSSTGSTVASARRRGKVWIENDADRARRHLPGDGYVLRRRDQHLDYDTFQEHAAPNTTSRLRLPGCAARLRDRGLARDDPRRARRPSARTPTRRIAISSSRRSRPCGLDPRPRDPRKRRALHAWGDKQPG